MINQIPHRAAVFPQSGIQHVLTPGELPNLLREWVVEPVSGIELQSRRRLQTHLAPSANVIKAFNESEWILQHVGINHALPAAGAEATKRLSTKEFPFESEPRNERNLPIRCSSPAIDDAVKSPVLPAEVAADVKRRRMIFIFAA